MTISCLDGHPQKFICKKLQNDQTSKILYLKNFPIYGNVIEFAKNVCSLTLLITTVSIANEQ